MKLLYPLIFLLLSCSTEPEPIICSELTEVELWGECFDIESTTEINLTVERLTGSIPPEIGYLTNLTKLYLYTNQLTGEIPPEIGNLPNLTHLSLMNNKLTGGIPPEIGNLTNLILFTSKNNQLFGEIPPEVCDLMESNNLHMANILDGNNLINTCE
jgi:Leucine-rich repeat (LRR) protein